MKVNNYSIDIDFNKSRYVISCEGVKLFSCSLTNSINNVIRLIEGSKGE